MLLLALSLLCVGSESVIGSAGTSGFASSFEAGFSPPG
jgi:hypothetical protein